ncbi:MAG: tetratricopeptide repeat protein [Lachnospiraceae bacterium]|nr:tetratricopeptide repeat protein [Lachnospiraceae bacterium]
MDTKRKIILALIVVLSLFLVVGVGLAAWFGYESNSYSRHIARAEKYVALGDYDHAVLEYQAAIDKEPQREEVYEKLAEVYATMGQNTMARSILRTGADRTGSTRLTDMLTRYLDNGMVSGNNVVIGENPSNAEMELQDGDSINYTLLHTIGSTEYNEYRLDHEVSSNSTSDGGCMVRVSGITADLYYDKKSTDSTGNKPIATAYPARATVDNAIMIFNGKNSVSVDDLDDLGADNIGTLDDPSHGKIVTFVCSGCTVKIALDANNRIVSGAWNEVIPFATTEGGEEGTGSCSADGKIKSATTTGTISGAELHFRKGRQTYGDVVASAKTDAFGVYSVHLDPGDYNVEVECVGYTTEYVDVYVPGSDSTTIGDIFLSPLLADGQIRIVLEWGSSPSDLDSHLTGRTDSGTNIHTYYSNKTESRGGNTIAELDVDDTDGYGPETTTLYDTNGVYTFSVVDFTESGTMSNSNAVVKIYLPDGSAPIEVHICGGLNNYWNVCTIDHGKVTVNNNGSR